MIVNSNILTYQNESSISVLIVEEVILIWHLYLKLMSQAVVWLEFSVKYYSVGVHFGPTWTISMVHSEDGVKHSEKQSLIGSISPLNLSIKVITFYYPNLKSGQNCSILLLL